jgi:MFS family permease
MINKVIKRIAFIDIVFLIVIAAGALLGYILGVSLLSNIFKVTPWAFPIVIVAGLLAFGGYYYAMKGDANKAKMFFNSSVISVFFLILIIEALVFAAFMTKGQIPYEECETKRQTQEIKPIEFLSCVITGYTLSSEVEDVLWQQISFWIFFIILPIVFIYSLVWGFLSPTKLLPQPAMRVIAFVLAAYAARQVFGTFLLDLAAYGAWGVAGIIIPLLLSLMLKRVFDAFLGPLEVIKGTFYAMIGAEFYSWISDIDKKLDKIEATLKRERVDKNTLEGLKVVLEDIERTLDTHYKGYENAEIATTQKSPILMEINMLKQRASMLKTIAEQRLKTSTT